MESNEVRKSSKNKKILTSTLKIITICYALLILIYGLLTIFIDSSKSINFDSIEAAAANRRSQLLYGHPFVFLGIFLISSIYYNSAFIKTSTSYSVFLIVIAIISTILFFSSTAIAIYINESGLILCIVPTFLILMYSLYLIVKSKKLLEL